MKHLRLACTTRKAKQVSERRFLPLTSFIFAAVLGLANSTLSHAAQSSEESKQLLNNLVEEIKVTMNAIAQAEKRAGADPSDLDLSLEIPASLSPNLGLVMDLNAKEGFKVLSVSPQSVADKLGIQSQDVILSVNEIETTSQAHRDKAFEELAYVVAGDKLNLTIDKQGAVTQLQAEVEGQIIPAIKLQIGRFDGGDNSDNPETSNSSAGANGEACGIVSVFNRPPQTKELFRAYIRQINDDNVNRRRFKFKLPPGKHTLYVHEIINDVFFTRRSKLIQRAEKLEVEVEANKTYHIAAEFNRALKNKQRNNEYWQPVVWKVQEGTSCEL